jgi:hypothetical protein
MFQQDKSRACLKKETDLENNVFSHPPYKETRLDVQNALS